MDNDREDLTFTTLSGATSAGQQTYIVEQHVSFILYRMHLEENSI